MTTLLANYEEHRTLFRALLAADCDKRILLFRGVSGVGKSALFRACVAEARRRAKHLHCVPIQLKDSAISVAEIFYRLGDEIGWDHFPRFLEQVAAFQQTPTVNVEKNVMVGQNQISVALHAENLTDRSHRQVALTDACFQDLRVLPQPVLVALDTYESANSDVQQWLSSPFLVRAAKTTQVRVLITGKSTPNHLDHDFEWGYCCQAQEMRGVHEAEHWLPLVHDLYPHIPHDMAMFLLRTVCRANYGRPEAIMKVIQAVEWA
ncbi:MAG: ATP-binding protein [Anaerolinea sp.]|nr:ATP-binding protein [Anaerolinea sp.]